MKTDRVFGLFRVGLVVALLAGWVPAGLGQAPPVFEDEPAAKPAPVKPPPPPVRPAGPRVLPAPTAPPRVIPRVPVTPKPGVGRPPAFSRPVTVPVTHPATALKWDNETQEYDVKEGENLAPFTFWVTNTYTEDVVISEVKASCGCTKPVLPEIPWTLAPGESGKMEVSMKLAGKSGTLTKYLTIRSSAGQKILYVKAHIPTPDAPNNQLERLKRMQMAMANKQTVFTGDCASCHVTPGIGKMGKELYTASCGICHNAEHRAAMVPDLANLKKPTDEAYWREWITNGQGPGGRRSILMPAFGRAHKGPLTQEQIDSLITYLTSTKKPGEAEAPVGTQAPGKDDFLKLP